MKLKRMKLNHPGPRHSIHPLAEEEEGVAGEGVVEEGALILEKDQKEFVSTFTLDESASERLVEIHVIFNTMMLR